MNRIEFTISQRSLRLAAVGVLFVLAACQPVQPSGQRGENPVNNAASEADVEAELPIVKAAQPMSVPTAKSMEEAMTRPSYDACLAAAAGVTPDIQDCIAIEFEYQDARLNKAYQSVLAKGDQAADEALRVAQRKWIEERDAQCALDPDGGQAQQLESSDCALELTVKRAAELEAM